MRLSQRKRRRRGRTWPATKVVRDARKCAGARRRRFRFTLGKSDAAQQIPEARIISDRIEVGMRLKVQENVGVLLVGLLEPDKRLFVFSKPQIGVDERRSGDVTRLLASLQLLQKPQGI